MKYARLTAFFHLIAVMMRFTLLPLWLVVWLMPGMSPMGAQANKEPVDIFDAKPSPFAKDDRHTGFFAALGYTAGYSLHAASYTSKFFGVVKDYPGFRAITIHANAGWGLNNHVVLLGDVSASPGNTTFTPYRSLYTGMTGAIYPSKHSEWSLQAGAGYYRSYVSRTQLAGKGWLFKAAGNLEFSPHAALEALILFGNLTGDSSYPFPFRHNEVNVGLGVYYLIY